MNGEVGFIVDLVGNIGALGFIFWLVWRTTNHTIPRLAKSFDDSLKQQRLDFKELSQLERDDFHGALTDHREFFAQQLERERQVMERLAEALKDLKMEIRRG